MRASAASSRRIRITTAACPTMSTSSNTAGAKAALGLFSGVVISCEPKPPVPGALAPECNRACLYGFMDRYLDALVHTQPSKLPWASHARFTENTVELAIGAGQWA